MKLLLDENLARIEAELSKGFTGSVRVFDVGYGAATDAPFRACAPANSFVIVSSDSRRGR